MRMRRKNNLEERLATCGDRILYLDRDVLDFSVKDDRDLLDIAGIFGNDNPVELEIGCGKGKFVCDIAKQNPDINYLAVEKASNVIVDAAEKAVRSGLYDTLQFPFSMLSPDATRQLVKLCEENDVGFIAMQPLCGGVVENIPLAFGFLHQYENVVPLWGVQSQEELDQVLYFNEHPPVIDEKFHEDVEKIRMFFN